jgi:hypothetical protein
MLLLRAMRSKENAVHGPANPTVGAQGLFIAPASDLGQQLAQRGSLSPPCLPRKISGWAWRHPLQLALLVLAAVLLLAAGVPAQVEAATELIHAYGDASFEECFAVVETFDKGLVLAGTTNSLGDPNGDITLLKTDSVGTELWTKSYGGAGITNAGDDVKAVIEHSIDNGLVCAGTTSSFNGGSHADFILIKTDSMGVEQWTKTFGGAHDDEAFSLIEHSIDTGFVIAGTSQAFGLAGAWAGSYDFMVIKTNSMGLEQWTMTFGGTGDDKAHFVIEHSIDNGLVICGQTDSWGAGSLDFMLVKTNSLGAEQWTKTYGGTGDDDAYSVTEHSIDTGLVICGQSDSWGAGGKDFMLVKTNSVGAAQWTKTYGGSALDWGRSVIEHSIDTGLVMTGLTMSYGALFEMMLVKTDAAGVEQWTRTFGGSGTDASWFLIEHSIDNGLVLAAETDGFGAGLEQTLVIQPADGSGTAMTGQSPTETTVMTLAEADHTGSEVSQTLTEVDESLTDVDQTQTMTVIFANPSKSPSSSQSQTASQTASQSRSSTQTASKSRTATQTASQSRSSTQTASQTSTASGSPSHSLSPSASSSPSASANEIVNDPCDNNQCALNSTCVVSGSGNQYTCDCTTISTTAKDTVAVGQYCNTTLVGKPVSVTERNCPGCASLYVCDSAYDGSDAQSYIESVLVDLASAYCGCKNPSESLLGVFGPVQYVQRENELCIEFTLYSGNPNATAADIAKTLKKKPPTTFTVTTNRLTEFEPCDDEVNGCITSDDDGSLLWIIIGAASFCLILILAIAWYCIHKHVDKQYRVTSDANNVVELDTLENKA